MASYWGAFHGNDFVKIAWREELFRLNGGHGLWWTSILSELVLAKRYFVEMTLCGFARKWVSSNSFCSSYFV